MCNITCQVCLYSCISMYMCVSVETDTGGWKEAAHKDPSPHHRTLERGQPTEQCIGGQSDHM